MAISPDRIENRQGMGLAVYLHDFLVDHQTDPQGNVFYGKAISYDWIRSRWKDAPPIRTLKRYMARLKASRDVYVQALPWGQGMRVRVLGSVKWKAKSEQLELPFEPPEPLSISGGKRGKAGAKAADKPGENRVERDVPMVPLLSSPESHFWHRNELGNSLKKQTKNEPARSARVSPSEENSKAFEQRRRQLQEQAVQLLREEKAREVS